MSELAYWISKRHAALTVTPISGQGQFRQSVTVMLAEKAILALFTVPA
jgi:hypothetical protein